MLNNTVKHLYKFKLFNLYFSVLSFLVFTCKSLTNKKTINDKTINAAAYGNKATQPSVRVKIPPIKIGVID